jgi:hypothetical protein
MGRCIAGLGVRALAVDCRGDGLSTKPRSPSSFGTLNTDVLGDRDHPDGVGFGFGGVGFGGIPATLIYRILNIVCKQR